MPTARHCWRAVARWVSSAWWCWGLISVIGSGWDLVQTDSQLYAAFATPGVSRCPSSRAHHRTRVRLAGWPGSDKCAVGEIGLDYFLPALDRERQQSLFEAQLELAADFRLPALLHVRRSHAHVIATLKRVKLQRGGIIHAFAGSREEAREYIKLGFKLGLGGAATWPQALRLRRVLADLPLDAVVLETDSPDMAPVMFANQRNSPEHLPAICEALAGVMNISAQRLAEASTANACSVFNGKRTL